MIAKKFRISSNKDIESVKKDGKAFHSTSFTMLVKNRKDDEVCRFAFITSTNVSPLASLRARARRALSEGVRLNYSALKAGYDIVIIAKPVIVKTYTSEIMREVDAIFQKAKLLN